MNDKEIRYYAEVACLTAKRSDAERAKVGAVLVSADRVMAIGYNGTPTGWHTNECEILTETGLVTKPEVIHAEVNSLFKFLNNGISTKGSTMFLTLSPCLECAKALHLANVEEVYYVEQYRDTAGIDFLRKVGVTVQRLNMID